MGSALTPFLFPKSLLQLDIKKSKTIIIIIFIFLFYLQNPQKQKLTIIKFAFDHKASFNDPSFLLFLLIIAF